jgi:two-component system nitrogen regulation response regulator GlnG
MTRLLIVDDEPTVLFSLHKCLSPLPLDITTCGSGREAVRLASEQRPDVVLLDVCLPDMSGLDVYDDIRELLPGVPVIVITAFSTTDTAIKAMKRGAFEYLVKPVDVHRLREVVSRAAQVSKLNGTTFEPLEHTATGMDGTADAMVGLSSAMHEVYKAIGRVASQDVTVLILGESGTGKEVSARTIWQYSHRAAKPFVAINCAAIPEPLLESELFGYEKGAFTGATERRIGKFEYANGGTVFLDEIGDMTSATQAKVLRVIQEQRFERIGGTQTVATDVRIIAATNKNLAQMATEGTFRQDLFYRINGFTINLPPLRERRSDIVPLTNHFIARFNREMGKGVRAITPQAIDRLQAQDWPGNVRELQNTIRYAMIKAVGDVLVPECFPHNGSLDAERASVPDKEEEFSAMASFVRHLLENTPGDVYRQLSAVVDNVVLDVALRYAKGNQLQAAALLGISRTTLRAKLRSLGRTIEKQLSSDHETVETRCFNET